MNGNRGDFQNMPGHLVAEHLMAAATAKLNNQKYDFPGDVRFPIKNFE